MLPASLLCTEFELQARHLHLAPDQYVASARLRTWCEENRNRYYVPEWLLKAWNMSVIPTSLAPHNLLLRSHMQNRSGTTHLPQTPVGIHT
jgi:hypothetical protein